MILTEKEKKALKAIAENGMHGMGGTEPKDLFSDNFSWFYPEDIITRTGFNKHQVAGLISSLDDKGLIGSGEKLNEWFLFEEGITEAQRIWDEDKDEDLLFQAGSRKELLAILKKHRSGKKLYLMANSPIMIPDDKYFNSLNAVPVTFKYLSTELNKNVGLYWQLDNTPEAFVKVSVSKLCIFIG